MLLSNKLQYYSSNAIYSFIYMNVPTFILYIVEWKFEVEKRRVIKLMKDNFFSMTTGNLK